LGGNSWGTSRLSRYSSPIFVRTDKRLGTTLTYAYDNIYQLLTAKQGTTTKESYTYDAVGNRLSSVGVSPYSYNSSNQLTSIPGTTYTYDNNGNTKTKTTAAGTTTYTWDYENRLTQVVLPGTGGTVTYKYDPFGRRVQKAFTQGGATTTTNYLYDGDNLIEEVDQNGIVLARYTGSSERVDEPLAEVRSGATSYYDQDGLGSVTSLSDPVGGIAESYTFDSFGKLTASSGSVANSFRYTARDFDPESGLYYYRARYYDPSIGRFLGEDPIGLGSGINRYTYVRNNPITLYDPWGLMDWAYHVNRRNHGWGFLQDAEFRPSLPPNIRVNCRCVANGYQATVTVSFDITIWYGTQAQLEHENGHLQILQNYLQGRTQHYANTYERVYPDKQQCLRARDAIDKDLLGDWHVIKKLENDHDDWLQDALQWIFNLF
jgi:RHS repeat-associated protein